MMSSSVTSRFCQPRRHLVELEAGIASRSGRPVSTVAGVPAQTTTLRLPVRRPFAADALLRFLGTHTVAGVEYVQDRTYHRSLRLAGGSGSVALTLPDDNGTEVAATITVDDGRDHAAALAACRVVLDLDADPAAIDEHLATDPPLADCVSSAPGLRVPGAVDGPEILIRAMLGQQVTVAAAQTAAARLVGAAGDRLTTPTGRLTHLFPTPAAISGLGPTVITGPRRRADAIRAAAAAMANGSLVVSADRPLADLTRELVARPGIGPWTAGYVALRLGCDRDVLLATDMVIRQGAAVLGLPDSATELQRRSAQWRPYRSYAGMHLWRAALEHRKRVRLNQQR